jgi:integral membrane sensor domain MASE1
LFFELAGIAQGRSVVLTWAIWWVGDTMGVVLVAPICLALARGGWRLVPRKIETTVLLAVVAAAAVAVWYPALPVRHLLVPVAV